MSARFIKSGCQKKNDEVVVLQANIDDQTGEGLGFALEQIMKAGALDAYFSPVYMKKQRPAIELSVIAPINQISKFENLIFKYTTTKGIRHCFFKRKVMVRTFRKVSILGDTVRIKVAKYNKIVKLTPEYEDCKRIAINNGLNLEQVMQMAEERANDE